MPQVPIGPIHCVASSFIVHYSNRCVVPMRCVVPIHEDAFDGVANGPQARDAQLDSVGQENAVSGGVEHFAMLATGNLNSRGGRQLARLVPSRTNGSRSRKMNSGA